MLSARSNAGTPTPLDERYPVISSGSTTCTERVTLLRNDRRAAGNLGGQALQLGLIDYVAMDIVPVVFGCGKAYFGSFADGRLMLDDPDVIIQGQGVLHLRYPVRRVTTHVHD